MGEKVVPLATRRARMVAVGIFLSILGGTWDTWLHNAIGPNDLLSPPHLLIGFGACAGALVAFLTLQRDRHPAWRGLYRSLLLVPLAAPFDQLWHNYFGEELARTPMVIWSPPHVVLVVGMMLGCLCLLPLLRRDPDATARQMLTTMIYATLLTLVTFLAGPLIPVGPFHLWGIWGEGLIAVIFVMIILAARQDLPGFGAATQFAFVVATLTAVAYWRPVSHAVGIPLHDHPPGWVVMFSFLVPALLVDLLHRRLSRPILGALVGFVSAGIFYPLSRLYFIPEASYSLSDANLAVLMGLVGGFFSGLIFDLTLWTSKHLATKHRKSGKAGR